MKNIDKTSKDSEDTWAVDISNKLVIYGQLCILIHYTFGIVTFIEYISEINIVYYKGFFIAKILLGTLESGSTLTTLVS